MTRTKKALIGLALFVAVGLVGNMDREDEQAQKTRCTEMVTKGAWPAEVCK